jgi:hypothetical protein
VVDEEGAGRIYNLEGVWRPWTARRGRDPAAEDRRRRRSSRGYCGWEQRLGLQTLTACYLYCGGAGYRAGVGPRARSGCWPAGPIAAPAQHLTG